MTICTKDKEYFFGEIEKEKMVLNEAGKIVQEELLQTSIIRPNVFLDQWVIMPNHVHVIIEINNQLTDDIATHCRNASLGRDALQCVSTGVPMQYKNKFGPQMNNLASIIRGFKGVVTKRAHMCDLDFSWQPRFYDHIIRNDESLNKIREYIETNPRMWGRDRNLPENLWM